MPKRTDLKKIMVIGSGPIVIGQACEFDYSGTQGIKALKEEGYEVVLVNSNPATIMTDPGLADRTYIEPIEPETVAAIVRKERPCAILPTLGGQTGLNTALALAKSGVLAECGTELIGARAEVIEKAESRELFRQAMENIGLKVPQSAIAHNMDDVRRIVTICTEMAPARCRLWRMYTDAYDRRPIVLSEGPALGDGWLSFHSGVSVEGPDGDIVVSFGTKRSFQAEAYLPSLHAASFGTECVSGHTAPYLDRFIVGRSRLSGPLPRNHPFVMGALFSILWADRQTLGRSWRGEWDARSWLDYTGFDRKLPRWRMGRRSLSRAQLVPTESALADTNSRLGATFAVVIDSPPRLGSFALSGHDCKRQERRLHEMAIVTQGTETPRLDPPAPQAAGTAWLASAGGIPDPERGQQASQCDLAMKLAENAWTPPEAALPSSLALPAEALDPAPPFTAGTSLLSASGSPLPEVEPEHGILSAQALSMKPNAWAAPESAGLSALGTGTPALAPAPPASGLLTLFAPQWAGAWTQTGQDWKTPSHITIQ